MPDRTVTLLLVEDDEIDAEAIRRGLLAQRIANPVRRVNDGIEALEALRASRGSENYVRRPYLVLLDLNMPRMSGIEFLTEIRRDEDLKGSVVFVLTTSDSDRDMVAAYDRNVAGYVVKTQIDGEYMDLCELLDHYWRIIEFP